MVVAAALALILAAPSPRERARQVLKSAGCEKCHDSSVSTQTPGALAVYDLREDNWPRRMSDGQLPKLLGRLRSAPAGDRKIVQQFIDTELRARHP